MMRLVLIFSLLLSLSLSSSAQTCSTDNSFSNNLTYSSCKDLPYLNSSIYWNYNSSSGSLQIAYIHAGITTSNWVAWAINPSAAAMVGSQALVAFQQSDGSIKAYKSQITSYVTNLPEGKLQYDVSNLKATYANGTIIIYATIALPSKTTTINQVWQEGPVSNDNPAAHPLAFANVNSKGTLDLLLGPSATGPSTTGNGGSSSASTPAPNVNSSSNGRMLASVLLRFSISTLCGWKLIHGILF